jgi:2-polyprenyl-3-methyl-5-hydroxy-6-metoxy-1,4-benzoquinol methylase
MTNTLTDEEKVTIDSYNAKAESWSKSHSTLKHLDNELEIFNSLLPEGRILEIGCAGGKDAKLLSSKGYEYLGTDVSENFVNIARRDNPNLQFLTKNILELGDEFPKDSFDGFWASAVLLHIPKKKIDNVLLVLHKLLKPGGIGFISIKAGKGESMIEDVSDDGNKYKRLWSFYSKKEFQDTLSKNSFEVVKYIYRSDDHRDRWLKYFVRNIK